VDELEYQGELAPRRKAAAAMLTALHPALGYLYVGRPKSAALAAAGFALYAAGFVGLWAGSQFFPLVPVVVFALGWVALVLLCLWGVLREVQNLGERYVLQGSNHPVVYSLAYVFGGLVPLYAAWFLASGVLFGVVKINDSAMLPSLQPGDLILVDQLAYKLREPHKGDLVVVERDTNSVFVGRVLGLEGDSVGVKGGLVTVNGAALPRYALARPPQASADGEAPPSRIVAEQNGERRYPVYGTAHTDQEVEPRDVTEGKLLLAGDNRAALTGASLYRVSKQQVLGRPRYILMASGPSALPEGTPEATEGLDRVGLKLE
jgi:signal peptidase I